MLFNLISWLTWRTWVLKQLGSFTQYLNYSKEGKRYSRYYPRGTTVPDIEQATEIILHFVYDLLVTNKLTKNLFQKGLVYCNKQTLCNVWVMCHFTPVRSPSQIQNISTNYWRFLFKTNLKDLIIQIYYFIKINKIFNNPDRMLLFQ